MCLTLHWFNPLVWWAAVLSRNDAELACDEATIRQLGESERAEYGRTLIELTCQKRPTLLLTATAMSGNKNCIKERIVMIAKKPKTAILTLVAVLLIAALAVGCAFTGARETGSSPSVPSAEGNEETEPTEPEQDDPDEPSSEQQEPVGSPFPTELLDDLFDHGNVFLTLYLSDDTTGSTYPTAAPGESAYPRFKVILSKYYRWTELEAPPAEGDYWLIATSGDTNEIKRMTFIEDGGAGTVIYTNGTDTSYWRATPTKDSYNLSVAKDIRQEYDNLEVSFSRISFHCEGSAEEAADLFVHSVYGAHRLSLSPGNMYGVRDWEATRWEVREVSDDGNAVVGAFEAAFTPWDFDSPGVWAGNTVEGEGEYEGKLICYRQFVLQRQGSEWYCIGMGTGGYTLPE